MSRVPPVELDRLDPATQKAIGDAERMMGFVPSDALVMAHFPALTHAFAAMVRAIYAPGTIPCGLKRLIGEAASKAAGCFYCSAHAAYGASRHGISDEKIRAVWDADASALFTPAERAAIRLAIVAGRNAAEVTDDDVAALVPHYDPAQIVEIVAVISMFGFLNRWNLTLGTALEPQPMSFVQAFDAPPPAR